jgi:hypothetical protein
VKEITQFWPIQFEGSFFLNGKISRNNISIGLQIRTSANSILAKQVIENRHKTKLKNFNLQILLLATTNLNPDIKSSDEKNCQNRDIMKFEYLNVSCEIYLIIICDQKIFDACLLSFC